MIRFTTGNLLDAETEAIVNTVNTVGVMGKGVALQFREAFPENYQAYKKACEAMAVHIGKVFVTENPALTGPKYIVNFPTKKHWRHPSRIEYVTSGLRDLRRVLEQKKIRSVALPPLGCGNGGLEWAEVRAEIEKALGDLQGVDVVVYQPTTSYQNEVKKEGVAELTPARAMIVELIRRYLAIGFECSNLEVHKLAWFLQRFIVAFELSNPLRLKFEANRFGPYADNLRQLLNALDGSFLHCAKRLADAGPMEPITVDSNRLPEVAAFMAGEEVKAFRQALKTTENLIDGFETPFLMELLSTVDWIQREHHRPLDTAEIVAALKSWPGGKTAARRKLSIFNRDTIDLARERLASYQHMLYENASDEAVLPSSN
jgi:O-acetyl-ADP-ribose deacetylase (regulator of RNase III)